MCAVLSYGALCICLHIPCTIRCPFRSVIHVWFILLFLVYSSWPHYFLLLAIVASKLTSGATFWEAFVSFAYLFGFMIPTRSGSPCIARVCWA
ncbi:hypothetical protein J3E71DRAFT_274915 [Bipolaris maydis]|nr:hypothetical protein J3E71DRAFT_274915 [Bipolaris maydis]